MSSFAAAIFGDKQLVKILDENNLFTDLTIEASTNETHSSSASITDHPVEDGSTISDHVRKNPDELSMVGWVSNDQIIALKAIRATSSVTGGDPTTRAEDAYEFLLDRQNKGITFRVTTTLREYRNMILTSLSVPRNVNRANMVELQMSFRELVIASTEQVAAPTPKNPSRSPQSNNGNQGIKPAPGPISSAALKFATK